MIFSSNDMLFLLLLLFVAFQNVVVFIILFLYLLSNRTLIDAFICRYWHRTILYKKYFKKDQKKVVYPKKDLFYPVLLEGECPFMQVDLFPDNSYSDSYRNELKVYDKSIWFDILRNHSSLKYRFWIFWSFTKAEIGYGLFLLLWFCIMPYN